MNGQVYQRRGRWWVRFNHDGKEYRRSAARLLGKLPAEVTEREAGEVLEDQLRACHQGQFVEPRYRRVTVGELLDDLLLQLEVRGIKSLLTYRWHVTRLKREVGPMRAQRFRSEQLDRFARTLQGQGYAPAYVNGLLTILGQALRLAKRRRKIAEVPEITRLRVNNARQGFVEPQAFPGILAGLHDAYRDATEFAWLSAWRKQEVLGLRWPAVNLTAREVTLAETKNGERRTLPLDGAGLRLLTRRWHARGLGVPWVFHQGGKPLHPATLLRKFSQAAAAAGCPGLVFHDLRRSAVRNMIRSGVPQSVAMRISGHRSATIFRRYDIVSDADVRDALRMTERYVADKRLDNGHPAASQAADSMDAGA